MHLRHAHRSWPARFPSRAILPLHTAHCTVQDFLAHVSSNVTRLLERDAKCEKEGETATKVHAQVISGAEWCDRLARRPLARLLLFSSCSRIFSLSALWIHMDVTMAVQGCGRPCLLSSSYCRLTLGRPLFLPSLHRPPSHRDSSWKREDGHDDGDEKKSELTCSRRQQPRQHGAENEEDTIPARHMPR